MEKKQTTQKPETIDEYLELVPEISKKTLQTIRKAIRAAAPKATEVIYYQMPTFKQEYALISFAAFTNHCSLFTLSNGVMKAFAKELEPFHCKGITIHFPLDKPLPATLIKKIVQFRLVEDASRAQARNIKKKQKK